MVQGSARVCFTWLVCLGFCEGCMTHADGVELFAS